MPPVGGRHIATYAICSAESGMSVVVSARTGSATIALNRKAYSDNMSAGCMCVYNRAVSLFRMSIGCVGARGWEDEDITVVILDRLRCEGCGG